MEVWKDIKGYEGIYQVSNKGRIKSLERYRERNDGILMKIKEKVLKPRIDSKGYVKFDLTKGNKKKTFLVHRLVAADFIPNPENKLEINHKDGNKNNNEVTNLEWNTRSENIKHAYETGLKKATMLRGEKNFRTKLSLEQIQFIRENYIPKDNEYGERALGKKFGVSQNAISKVVNHKTWTDVI